MGTIPRINSYLLTSASASSTGTKELLDSNPARAGQGQKRHIGCLGADLHSK